MDKFKQHTKLKHKKGRSRISSGENTSEDDQRTEGANVPTTSSQGLIPGPQTSKKSKHIVHSESRSPTSISGTAASTPVLQRKQYDHAEKLRLALQSQATVRLERREKEDDTTSRRTSISEVMEVSGISSAVATPRKRQRTDSDGSAEEQTKLKRTSASRKDKPKEAQLTEPQSESAQAAALVKELTDFCLNPRYKINKEQANFVLSRVGCLKGSIDKLLLSNAEMTGRLKEREVLTQVRPPQKTSYAQIAAQGIKRTPAAAPPVVLHNQRKKPIKITAKPWVVVRPAAPEEAVSSEVTKELLMRAFDPRVQNVRIRNVRKTRDNGVIVEAATKEDLEKMMKDTRIAASGLTIETPSKRGPRVVIFDVPKISVEGDDFVKTVYQQNPEYSSAGISEEEFEKEFVVRFHTGKRREDETNVVVETSSRVRGIIRSKNGRTYIGWASCRVQDFLGLSRCFKCQGFGHIAKFCKQETDTCSHCADSGHKGSDCTKKELPKKCATCKRAKRPSNHSVNSKTCPCYLMAAERLTSETDYGQ